MDHGRWFAAEISGDQLGAIGVGLSASVGRVTPGSHPMFDPAAFNPKMLI